MIDLTVTACIRPQIIRRTLSSFKRNLFKDVPCRLILNVDQVGEYGTKYEIYNIAQQFFKGICRITETPSFPEAFIWTWSQTKRDFVFHLEDDWELLRPVDIYAMFRIMEKYEDLAVLRLPYKSTGLQSAKNWKYFFPFNGDFFECPEELRQEVGFCGHPSLIRGEFVRRAVVHLDPKKNPEKQFHHGNPGLIAEVLRWRYGVYAGPNEPAAIRDIGRKWMVKEGFKKAGNKAFFTEWERRDNGN